MPILSENEINNLPQNTLVNLLSTNGNEGSSSYNTLKDLNIKNYEKTNINSINNIVSAINKNLTELNLIQNQLNTLNNVNQDALLKKDQLIRLENDDLTKQLRELESIQSIIANKSRYIDQSNNVIFKQDKDIKFLYISAFFAFIIFVLIILYVLTYISINFFITTIIIIIILYLSYSIYYYNFMYVKSSTDALFDKSGSRIYNAVSKLDNYIEQEIEYNLGLFNNKNEWVENNCDCENSDKDNSNNNDYNNKGTEYSGSKEIPGNFYYDGTAPKQLLPSDIDLEPKDRINWVDYSGDGNPKYIPYINSTLYDNNNFYNAKNIKNDPELQKNRYNPNFLVNNVTLTDN